MSADKIFGHPSYYRAYDILSAMSDEDLDDPTEINTMAKTLRGLGLSQDKISKAVKRLKLERKVRSFDGDPKIAEILKLLESLI